MRIGSLFTGYGGLDMGLQAVLGGTVAWHADIDPGPCILLAHHHPHVPNLGDVSAIDFHDVEPVDVLTGGFPCQDVSAAGLRAGLAPGTRSGLWSEMQRAIATQRPALVVAENVRGLLNAPAHPAGDVGPDPWGVGDGPGRPLRAIGAVLGDLAELGYDARWYGLRAADAGAPHARFRVFVFAWPTDAGTTDPHDPGLEGPRRQAGPHPGPTPLGDHGVAADPERGRRGGGSGQQWPCGGPEPAHGGDAVPDAHRIRRERLGGVEPFERDLDRPGGANVAWGNYEPAIRRWEHLTGHRAPPPTAPGRTGAPRLSPVFVEWMMGLPPGHVTDVPGLNRKHHLKLLGNGVVPQQATLAATLFAAEHPDFLARLHPPTPALAATP